MFKLVKNLPLATFGQKNGVVSTAPFFSASELAQCRLASAEFPDDEIEPVIARAVGIRNSHPAKFAPPRALVRFREDMLRGMAR